MRTSRPPRRPPAARSGSGLWVALLALAAIAVLGRFLGRRPEAPFPPLAPSHPASTMAIAAASETAMALRQAGRNLESVPYLRRVVAELPDVWQAHCNYSTALHDAAQETRTHLGRPDPATRSSLERVRMSWESLRELDLAEGCAATPHERALVIVQRGQRLQNWGLPIEALREFRRAVELDPVSPELASYVGEALERLGSGATPTR